MVVKNGGPEVPEGTVKLPAPLLGVWKVGTGSRRHLGRLTQHGSRGRDNCSRLDILGILHRVELDIESVASLCHSKRPPVEVEVCAC